MHKFSVWAPKAKNVELVICGKEEKKYPMTKAENGYFTAELLLDADGIDYLFLLDNEKKRPDPRSFWQPYGVHGPSRFYDHAKFLWSDSDWKQIPFKDYIIYELHIGTFTAEATFQAAIDKLPHLKSLGITAIELMPVIEFPGGRNWGYDGTYPYAPHHCYGGPDGLKTLINECHRQGFAVILDVVYNHLGPEGNYLGDFGYYFTDHYKTPWGQAVNYDGEYCDPVRSYIISNALYWAREFHVDALRLDAVHAIYDMSAKHILEELEFVLKNQEKQVYIIAESDLNDVRILNDRSEGGYCLDAQWSDDFHHAVHAYCTGSSHAYFEDFGTLADIAKAFKSGFIYDGNYSKHRKRCFGSSSENVRGDQLVITLQNHDQIGNGTHGARLNTIISDELYRLATLLLFYAPNVPLIFMGQEWGAKTPFLYFTSFEDHDLVESVTKGYIKENRAHAMDLNQLNPQNCDRFVRSKLNWTEIAAKEHSSMLAYYKAVISARKRHRVLSNCRKDLTKVSYDEEKKWLIVERGCTTSQEKALLIVNFSEQVQEIALDCQNSSKDLVWQLCLQSSKASNEHIPSQLIGQQSIKIPGHTGIVYIMHNSCQSSEIVDI